MPRDLPVALALLGFLITFLVLPIGSVVVDSLRGEEGFTLRYFQQFLTTPFYIGATVNSFIWAFLTVLAASALGVPFAYILARYDVKGKTLIRTLLLIPLISPPFVSAIALVQLFGSYGTLNIMLMEWFAVTQEPVNFIFGLHGLVFVAALHSFPLIMLTTEAAFSAINKEFEEVAEIHGCSGLLRFRRITLPLASPGYITGVLLVFIFTFADWPTPLVLRQHGYLASEVYTHVFENLGGIFDIDRYRLGLVGAVMIAAVAIGSLLLTRKYLERRKYALRGVGRLVPVVGGKRAGIYAFSALAITLAVLPPTWIVLSALSKAWSFTAFPRIWTLEHFQYVVVGAPRFVSNSLTFALTGLGIALAAGIPLAYVLTRSEIRGKGALDSMVTFALVIPGIIIGLGYMLLFGSPTLGFPLARHWIVMPLVMAVHRLPFVVRSAYASFLALDRSLEEVAYVLGAGRAYTLVRITLRLSVRGVAAGALFMLVYALQELSSLIFLYRPGWETMTIGIFNFFLSGGSFEIASALGVVLLAVVAALIATAFKLTERATSYQVA